MIKKMPRINKIIENDKYQSLVARLDSLEKDRKFCKHDIPHFLDTARIMYIISLENNYGIEKEVIYAAALIHDIGRVTEYENNIPHDKASADFANEILPKCGFSEKETKIIINAILNHRSDENDNKLSKLLYFADKKSRLCLFCKVKNDCYWDNDKKNNEIII